MSIISAAISRSRTVITIFCFLLIAGTYSYINIAKESDPDITIPIIYITMHHDGISPDDSEKLLVRPMEQELKSLEGLKEISGTAYENGANILLEFEAGFDADKAMEDVREKVDVVKPDLPKDTDEPTINEVNLSRFPILSVSLYGNVPFRLLREAAEELKENIEALPDVLAVDMSGDREEVVELIISPELIESYNLKPAELITALQSANMLVAAGAVNQKGGYFSVEVADRIKNAPELLNMPLIVRDESVVRVRDVADVRRTFKDSKTYSRVNGIPAIILSVKKRTGRNIIATIDKVRAVTKASEEKMPAGIQLLVGQDKSVRIRSRLNDLTNSITASILLVMMVVLAVLGFRGGFLVGLAIPGSFLAALLVLYATGFTMNIVVLFALILSVGMLVDGAIVVSEYADRRNREGASLTDAYSEAAKRMSWPIIASTTTTLLAFLPLLFWPGIVGEFMKFLPITLIITLTASLAMALIFLPILGTNLHILGRIIFVAIIGIFSYSLPAMGTKILSISAPPSWLMTLLSLIFTIIGFWLSLRYAERLIPSPTNQLAHDDKNADNGDSKDMAAPAPSFFNKMSHYYERLVSRALNHPIKILSGMFSLLVTVYIIYGAYGKGVEFFPSIEPETFSIEISARGNLSLDEKVSLISEVEDKVIALQERRGEFLLIATKVGDIANNNSSPDDAIGNITLQLHDWSVRRKTQNIIDELRDDLQNVSGIHLEFVKERKGPASGKPIHLRVSGEEWPAIVAELNRIEQWMRDDGRMVDFQNSLPVPGIVWKLDLDRAQALKFGVDTNQISSMVKLVTQGVKITDIQPNDSNDKIDIVARFPDEYRTLNYLDKVRINTEFGAVPIGNFIDKNVKPATSLIRRVDMTRIHFVKADVREGVLADDVIRDLVTWLDENPPNNDVTVSLEGEEEDKKNSRGFLIKAFSVALFLMAIALLTQFNNFYSVVLILGAVVMSTLGVLLGLLITGQPFGIIMSGIGVIALAGIVVNNNIVLIDTFDNYIKQGYSVNDAILTTSLERFRPVLLTTITTILGLMPMVLKMNIDFLAPAIEIGGPSTQWWSQLATAIVFGLAFSTVLTLIMTPVALSLRGRVAFLNTQRHV